MSEHLYIRKPSTVEARRVPLLARLDSKAIVESGQLIGWLASTGVKFSVADSKGSIKIRTRDKLDVAKPGDWIVRIEDDVFEVWSDEDFTECHTAKKFIDEGIASAHALSAALKGKETVTLNDSPTEASVQAMKDHASEGIFSADKN